MSERAGGDKRCAAVRLTKPRQRAFLDHLAATCDVRAAAAAAGVDPIAAHRRRRTDPVFAAAWECAIEAGYQLLETRLIGCALVLSGGVPLGAGEHAPDKGLDFDPGYRMLRHRAEVRKPARGRGMPAAPTTRDEADKQILAKLASLAARRARA